MGVLAVVLAVTLSACSDDGDEPSGSGSKTPDATLTEVTVDCPEFADTAQKITDAQTELYSGTADDATIDELVGELDGLKEGAPDDVQTALDDMGAAFRDASELLDDPTPANRAQLLDLGPKLAEDGQTITAYITAQCG
jgi:hypothetical protein